MGTNYLDDPPVFEFFPGTEGQPMKKAKHRSSRCLEIVVENVECICSEAALRHFLLGLRGVLDVRIDSIANVVYVDYDRNSLSTPSILANLRTASFTPLRSSLQGWASGGGILSQLTLRVPPSFRTVHGWTLLPNHLLAQDGVASCVFNTEGTEVTISFQSELIGPRQLLAYANRAGAECTVAMTPPISNSTQSGAAGDWRLMLTCALGLCLFPTLPFVSDFPIGCLPLKRWFELFICFCAAASHGATHLRAATTAATTRNFTAYLALVLSNLLIFITSIILVLQIARTDAPPDTTALLQFSTVAWLLIIWCLGLKGLRKIKNGLYKPINNIQRLIQKKGNSTLVDAEGNRQVIESRLVQVGDILLFKAGEFVWCDGIVQQHHDSTQQTLIKESSLVSQHGDTLPRFITPGCRVFAGTLVMRNNLYVKVTHTDDSQLARAILASRKGALRPVICCKWIQNHARLLGMVTFVFGLVVAFRSWQQDVSINELVSEDGPPGLLSSLSLLKAACLAAGVWLALSTFALNSASTAVPVASAGMAAASGNIINDCDALDRVSRSKRIVIMGRSTLCVREAASISALVICPLACNSVLQTGCRRDIVVDQEEEDDLLEDPHYDLFSPNQKAQDWKLYRVESDTIVEGETPQDGACADLLWRIIGHLETAALRDGTGSWLASLLRANAAKAVPSHSNGAMTQRTFVGKGIEGDPPEELSVGSTGGVAAVGSLDYIAGCHQFAFNSNGAVGRSEWGTLQRWCADRLQHGFQPVVVSLNGRPLGAVLVSVPLSPFVRPTVHFLENRLNMEVWLYSSLDPLSAASLASQTGVKNGRVICGAMTDEKAKAVQSDISATIISDSATLLDTIGGGNVATVLLGELPSRSLARRTDIAIPAQSLVNVLNLFCIAKVSHTVNNFCKIMAGCVVLLSVIWSLVVSETSWWSYAPLLGLSIAFLADLSVLSCAFLLNGFEPAQFIRYASSAKENLVFPPHLTGIQLIYASTSIVAQRIIGHFGLKLLEIMRLGRGNKRGATVGQVGGNMSPNSGTFTPPNNVPPSHNLDI